MPVDVAPTVNSLPRNMQETDTISVKIKCKHSYKYHVLAENIRPRKVLEALHYLLQNSTMFQNENIQIDADWLTKLLMDESNAPSPVTHDVPETAATQVKQDQMEMTQSDVTSSSTVDTTDATSMLPVEHEDGDDNYDQKQEEDDEPANAPSTNTMLHDKDIDPTNTTLQSSFFSFYSFVYANCWKLVSLFLRCSVATCICCPKGALWFGECL